MENTGHFSMWLTTKLGQKPKLHEGVNLIVRRIPAVSGIGLRN